MSDSVEINVTVGTNAANVEVEVANGDLSRYEEMLALTRTSEKFGEVLL